MKKQDKFFVAPQKNSLETRQEFGQDQAYSRVEDNLKPKENKT